MNRTILRIIEELIGREGGYSNHPSDRGGATRWGITEQVARAYGYKGDMQLLPRETAISIYYKRYWTEPRLHDVHNILPQVAIEMFDTGVNMGPVIAVQFLQRSLNLLNRRGKAWPDIAQDGRIGPMTLDALSRYITERGTKAAPVLLKSLDGLQAARYADIAEARPANEDFYFGWIDKRIGDLL